MPDANNRTHVERVMTLLASGIRPFVERRLLAVDGSGWMAKAQETIAERRVLAPDDLNDVSRLCGLLLGRWREAFEDLGPDNRSLVFEIKDARNRWAHQQAFSDRDVLRLADSAQRLLAAIKAPEAKELEVMHEELRAGGSGKRLVVTVAVAAVVVAVVVGLIRMQDDEPTMEPTTSTPTLVEPVRELQPAALAAEPPEPASGATQGESTGDRFTICGRVTRTHWAKSSKGAPTFINVRDARSREEMPVVIWEDDRAAFIEALGANPEDAYRDKSICASGKLDEYQGRDEVVVTRPEDIVVNQEAAKPEAKSDETCGTVVRTHWARASKGSPTFITLDADSHDTPLTVVIWEPLREPFNERFGHAPEDLSAGTRLCVKAPLTEYKGALELEPETVDAIRIPSR